MSEDEPQPLRQAWSDIDTELKRRHDRHFLELQRELVKTEDRIQASRRFYNGNVRELNNRVEMFSSSLVASLMGQRAADYFEIDALHESAVPRIGLPH